MSEPKPDPAKPDGPINTDAPVISTGGDSVPDMHRAHMTQMNDPVMLTADGVDDTADDEPGAGGSDSVQGMHTAVIREHGEPRDGFEPVPFWVAVVCGGLLAWGGYYIGAYTADFRRDVYDRSDLKDVSPPAVAAPDPNPKTVDDLKRIGEQKYQTICASCHGPEGKGQPAQNIPPLDGSNWVAGDQASAARLSRILLYGLNGPIEVKTSALARTYSGAVMPNQGNILKDYEIAGVLTYVRNNWSNKADPDNAKPAITADEVKAARAKEGNRKANGTQPVAAEELLKIPTTYSDTGTAAAAPKADGKK
jgi:mono/diheme cytochrome c family protein